MKTTHTPGPWTLEMPPAGEWSSRWAYVRADGWGVVTSIKLDNSLPHWDGPQRANARLIAAAPEMFELLREIGNANSAQVAPVYAELARALTAKATGSAA